MIINSLVLFKFSFRYKNILVSILKIIKSCKDMLQWGGSNGKGVVILHVEAMPLIIVTDGLGVPCNRIIFLFNSLQFRSSYEMFNTIIQNIIQFSFKFKVWKHEEMRV